MFVSSAIQKSTFKFTCIFPIQNIQDLILIRRLHVTERRTRRATSQSEGEKYRRKKRKKEKKLQFSFLRFLSLKQLRESECAKKVCTFIQFFQRLKRGINCRNQHTYTMTLIILNPDHFISGLPGLLACHAFFCLLSLPEINSSVNSQPGEIVDLQGMKRKKMKEEKNSCLRKKQKKRDHPCVICVLQKMASQLRLEHFTCATSLVEKPTLIWRSNTYIEQYLLVYVCLLYTSPSPRDRQKSRMPSSA